jgi:hypothetical protein
MFYEALFRIKKPYYMKSKLIFAIASLLFVVSCNEEEFSPSTATVVENQGWPFQTLQIAFDNPDSKAFEVTFGSTRANAVPMSTGLKVTIPSLPANQTVDITIKTPNGNLLAKDDFLIRGKPEIVYALPTTFSHRVPLKVILKNADYFEGQVAFSFCESNSDQFCYEGTYSMAGDTLVFKPNLSYKNYNLRLKGNPSFQFEGVGYETMSVVKTSNSFTYRPSYSAVNTSSAAGGKVSIVFNDTDFFPDDLIVILKSAQGTEVQLENTGWDFVGGSGYANAMFGQFKVPAIPAGVYEFVIRDPNNIQYLHEKSNKFTITN